MFFERLFNAVKISLKPAARTVIWILKLMIPITLAVSYLNYIGVVGYLSQLISPLFKYIGLSGDAVFVFITSILINLYSAVAVIATLGFDFRSATILSVMCLIAHNLIMETAIQKKAGASAMLMIVIRISTAFIAGAVLNMTLPKDMTGRIFLGEIAANPTSIGELFVSWFNSIWPLTIRMILFVFGLNILQNILREFGVIDILIYPLKPFMKIFGLPESTSFLWIVANCVGLTYGGALMVDEIKKGEIAKNDAIMLNTHISISHSLLEDTLLFAAVGIGVLWLILPRMLLAIAAVWIQRLFFIRNNNKKIITLERR